MINDIEKESIVVEIRGLINGIENAKEEVNVYCDLMKQIFLSNSNKN